LKLTRDRHLFRLIELILTGLTALTVGMVKLLGRVFDLFGPMPLFGDWNIALPECRSTWKLPQVAHRTYRR